MHTSLVLFALMGPGAAPAVAAPEAPSWQESYRAARAAGRERSKPLAIFIGSGPAGWDKLTEGKLTRRARQLLAEGYVCVYVDQATAAGKQLAEAFEVGSGPGFIVSSRDGDAQAFWHKGTMSQGELEETLQKFTTVTTVQQTEKLSRTRYAYASYPDGTMRPTTEATTAYQPAVSYGVPAGYTLPMNYSPAQQTYAAPMMSRGGGGGC